VLGLVEHEVLPLLAAEGGVVLDDELVAGDADVEGVGLGPALSVSQEFSSLLLELKLFERLLQHISDYFKLFQIT
jgi:hypothetical protein